MSYNIVFHPVFADIYENVKILGTGQSGVVYRTKESYAKKELTDEQEAQKEVFFLQHLSKLPNIPVPKYIDHYMYDNRYYVIMEEVKGKTLSRFSSDFKVNFDITNLINYFIKLKEILINLAEEGYLHMDIKRDNVLVNSKNKVVLIDFSEAIHIKNLSDIDYQVQQYNKFLRAETGINFYFEDEFEMAKARYKKLIDNNRYSKSFDDFIIERSSSFIDWESIGVEPSLENALNYLDYVNHNKNLKLTNDDLTFPHKKSLHQFRRRKTRRKSRKKAKRQSRSKKSCKKRIPFTARARPL